MHQFICGVRAVQRSGKPFSRLPRGHCSDVTSASAGTPAGTFPKSSGVNPTHPTATEVLEKKGFTTERRAPPNVRHDQVGPTHLLLAAEKAARRKEISETRRELRVAGRGRARTATTKHKRPYGKDNNPLMTVDVRKEK